jgi:O-antigen/teichoic acid export membrane protein
VIFGLTLYSREIVSLVGGEQYAAAHYLLPVLAAAALLSGMYVLVPGLWLTKRTGWMLSINVGTAALSLVLNLVFIPLWGPLGAGLATLVSALANFVGYFVANQLTYRIPADYGRILLATSLFGALSIAGGHIAVTDDYLVRTAFLIVGLVLVLAPLISSTEAIRLLAAALAELRRGRDAS